MKKLLVILSLLLIPSLVWATSTKTTVGVSTLSNYQNTYTKPYVITSYSGKYGTSSSKFRNLEKQVEKNTKELKLIQKLLKENSRLTQENKRLLNKLNEKMLDQQLNFAN